MSEPKHQLPFKTLGKHLRFLRINRQASLAEVSGAIEIETEALERIEKGEERPDEDTLMLLISYFDIRDHEAVQIWRSAGYSKDEEQKHILKDSQNKVSTILLALDLRIMYSDCVTLAGSENGLVMNFMQKAGQAEPVTISRVGMSYSQAEEVLKTLEKVVLRNKYLPNIRLLPPGNSK
ncbi:MAG: helix-turn-helix domain-containing protein [Candidatus Saccharimonadales bacterium]